MILVTGGAGLLGAVLIEQLLLHGEKVRAIYHQTPITARSENLLTVQCDILDVYALEDAMRDIDEVYHCAALVSFSPADKKKLHKINVEGTANVVNAALSAGVRKLVHVSSVAALGRLRPGQVITEEMDWTEETGNSVYGQSKYFGEREIWRGIAEGLNAVIVNPVVILGPGDWNAGSSEIFKAVYNGFPWYASGTSGFVDVRDAAGAMTGLMKADISNERFIISAENLSYRDVFNLVADAFGKKRPAKKITPFLAGVKWRLDALNAMFTGTRPLVTKETAATSLSKSSFDNSKLLKALPGFQYRSIAQSIADTCKALQQKLNN